MNNEQQQHATSALTLMPATKDEMKRFADLVISEVLDGGIIDPIELDLRLKAIEETIKMIRKNPDLKRFTIDEAEKFGAKTFEYLGSKITISNRTTYDYKNSDDEIYNNLKEQEKQLKEQIKIREQIIKSGVDAATGEVIKPAATSTTTFLTIKLK